MDVVVSSTEVQGVGWTRNFMDIQMKLSLGVGMNFYGSTGKIELRDVTAHDNMRSGIFLSGKDMQATLQDTRAAKNGNGILALLMDSEVVLENISCNENRAEGLSLHCADTEFNYVFSNFELERILF